MKCAFIGLLAICLFFSCDRPDSDPITIATAAQADRSKQNKHPATSLVESFNRKDWAGVMERFAPKAQLVLLDSSQDPIAGQGDIRMFFENLVLVFPDAHASLVRLVAADNIWLLELVLAGSQLGEFLGQEVSQRRVGTQLAVFAWLKAGKIEKALVCGNPLAIIRQIKSKAISRRWLPPAALQSEIVTEKGDPAQIRSVRAFLAMFNSADLARLAEHVTADVTIHAYGDGKRLQGLETVRRALVSEREAFEGKFELEHAVTAGPYVAALVKVQGTLKTDLGPLKATGKHFAERGIDIFRLEGGKIAEWDNYRNLLDLLRQLGLDQNGRAIKP